MSEPIITHENASPRLPSSRSILVRFSRVTSFILGLSLSSFPFLLASLFLIAINDTFPINPNAPYHGEWIMIGRSMVFRGIQDLLTLLLILLTPVLTQFKRTRIASYGLAVGLLFLIALPLFTYVQDIVIHILIQHDPAYATLLPSSILSWLSFFKVSILPIIGLILVPIFARTPKTRWPGYVVAVIVAALFFLRSPIHYWL
ncbi:hypothetical protein ccbrp13_22940 [Ktedonobacteria bacterium brp13]|nr:hypothetical protein ccbrp13_22940 [Ktedonobacteria bacterium brp13]